MTRIAFCSIVFGSLIAACSATTSSPTPTGPGGQVGSTARSSTARYASDYDVYEGVTCDPDTEGLAWCDDDYTIAYCDAGTWWLLDCSDVFADYCADDGYIVDCYSY